MKNSSQRSSLPPVQDLDRSGSEYSRLWGTSMLLLGNAGPNRRRRRPCEWHLDEWRSTFSCKWICKQAKLLPLVQANPRSLHEKSLHSQKWQYGALCQHRESSSPTFLRMRLTVQLLLMRTAMWKCCKISSPHNSPVFLGMKTCYSSRMEQQECRCFVPEPSRFQKWGYPMAPLLPRLNPLRLFSLGVPENKSVRNKAKNYRRFKTANSRWSGCNSCGDAVTGHEQFQVPTWMHASKWKPSWGRYFQNTNFQTGINQNGYSYAFHLCQINR